MCRLICTYGEAAEEGESKSTPSAPMGRGVKVHALRANGEGAEEGGGWEREWGGESRVGRGEYSGEGETGSKRGAQSL